MKGRLELSIDEGGQRLDRLLAERIPDLSRRKAKRLIDGGAVFLDGKRCRVSSRIVRAGARVVVHADRDEEAGADIPVLYEDEHLLVVDKPPTLHVNETETSPIVALEARLSAEVRVVHRLDKETSGVLLFAKSPDAAQELSEAFRNRRVEKHYLAVCDGVPEPGLVDAPIGADPKRPKARAIRQDGKPAATRVEVLSSVSGVSAVACEPLTGRTHQIRLHLKRRGAPIVGDLTYGGPAAVRVGEAVVRPGRLLLHAHRLNVPFRGRVLAFEAPLPADFSGLTRQGLLFSPRGAIAS